MFCYEENITFAESHGLVEDKSRLNIQYSFSKQLFYQYELPKINAETD